MGNSSSKDKGQNTSSNARRPSSPTSRSAHGDSSGSGIQSPADRLAGQIYASRNGGSRGSRHDMAFLHLTRERGDDGGAQDRPRETKQERDARRAERERVARLKERERSMAEENVDGGYLVTLGTYTGVEDFNKAIVRQLQIERRLAPFWKGLNDHSDSWTEYQLVAAARGLPIPAPDEVPADMLRSASEMSNDHRHSPTNSANLTVPMSSRTQSYQSDTTTLSASHPAFSNSGPSSPTTATSAGSVIRGRAKTLASLATGKSQSPDMTPREIQLPHEPNYNGQPVEAYLYKDASECPICFLYYPPYLNRTRCCDQSICSECFVQIKRPDPHPPEHEQPGQERPPEEEADLLVSEVAACPFCVTPEFGVTYEPPPFKRGLAYANGRIAARATASPMSSTTSLPSGAGRRRGQSLSASAPQVITTDKVRPDWAQKLADARAHALRRSAAATALHNAAYVLGNQEMVIGGLGFGRRRRTLFRDSPSGSGNGTPLGSSSQLRALDSSGEHGGAGNRDLFPGRMSSRRNRVEDLEDLMMMEAIRLSLAAEEERKRKEEKEAKKGAKKRAKEEKKEAKAARKNSNAGSMYRAGTNESASSWASTSMARSTSNLGMQPSIPEEQVQGKGKAPAQDFAGFNPLSEPTSTLNTEVRQASEEKQKQDQLVAQSTSPSNDPQAHLQASRENFKATPSAPIPTSGISAHHRQMSGVSSAASSFVDSVPSSLRAESNLQPSNASMPDGSLSALDGTPGQSGTATPAGGAGLEPMFNFRSLAAMVGSEGKDSDGEHIEHAEQATKAEEEMKEPVPKGSPRPGSLLNGEGNRSRGDSGESSGGSRPPNYSEPTTAQKKEGGDGGDELIEPAPQAVSSDLDRKHYGQINVLNHQHADEATQ